MAAEGDAQVWFADGGRVGVVDDAIGARGTDELVRGIAAVSASAL
ncbi:MAG: hypothetical protein U0235_26035 [Polyangiaceae bacterium]